MASTIPAMKASFGSTDYYLTTMRAGELVEKLTIPGELAGWEDMTIEERFQRQVNYNRVKKHIAPYLASDPDRFFGALIVDIYNNRGLKFEPLGKILNDIPGLYRAAAEGFGFLHFTGGEVLVPLDGQHRLAALRFAISGKDEKGKDIKGLEPNLDVANDEVTVIFVNHDDKKARKIFNKVNRYAKATSKAENLITADDDIAAVLTRKIANDLIGERLVNYGSNTLSKKSECFTTLGTLYESSLKILEITLDKKIDTTDLPDLATQKLYSSTLFNAWGKLLEKIDLFSIALHDKSEAGDEKRREIREEFLLGKPITQLTLVLTYLRLRDSKDANGKKIPEKSIFERLNSINWTINDPMWQRVLMNGEKVMAGKTAAMFASRFVAYLCGEHLEGVEINALQDNYANMYPSNEQKGVKLPKRHFP